MRHFKISHRKHVNKAYGYLEDEYGLCYEAPNEVLIAFLQMKSDITTKALIIDSYKKRIKELESNMQAWISVKDRLPKSSGMFDGCNVNSGLKESFRVWFSQETGKFIFNNDYVDVTHWAELRPLPTTDVTLSV